MTIEPLTVGCRADDHADPWHLHAAVIEEIRPEVESVTTYTLKLRDASDPAACAARPGQFNMLYLPGVGESAISVSGDCRRADRFVHTVRAAGRVTITLSQLEVGDEIGLRGPFGSCWPIDGWRGRDVVLVAGGIGLAPLRPVIYELMHRRTEFGAVALIFGAREPRLLMYADEYAAWEAAGVSVITTVDRADDAWSGNVGVVTALLDRLPLRDPRSAVAAVCGPEVMIRYAALSAVKRGISSENVWVSLERNMQCAVGLCGHCQLGPEFICKDGPVLPYSRVARLLAVEGL